MVIYDDFPTASSNRAPLGSRGSTASVLGSPFGSAPSGYGAEYDLLFSQNPYRKNSYHQSFWQRLGSALGFRTGYDAWLENTQNQINEYDASIFSIMQQNQFNSPEAEASRMRQAGMNPDLLGTGDVAQGASPAEDPNGMPDQVVEDFGLEHVGKVCSTVLNIIPSAMSFATNLTNLKGLRLDNDMKELEFGTGVLDSVEDLFSTGITEQDYKDAFESGNFDNILNAAFKKSSALSDTLFSNPTARKRFQMLYGRYSNSIVSKIKRYGTFDEFLKNRESVLTKRANPFFSDDDDEMEKYLNSFLGPMFRYQKRMNEIFERRSNLRNPDLEQGLENKQMSNQLAYENAIDPTLQAQAENTVNERTSQENEIITATNQFFEDIMNELKQYDNWFSKIGMALIGIARAQVLSGLHMSFGRSQHVGSTPFGDTDVRDSIFQFGF